MGENKDALLAWLFLVLAGSVRRWRLLTSWVELDLLLWTPTWYPAWTRCCIYRLPFPSHRDLDRQTDGMLLDAMRCSPTWCWRSVLFPVLRVL